MPASAFHFFISPHFPSTLVSYLISLFPNSLPHDGMKWCVGADVLGHSCRMLMVATESEEKAEKLLCTQIPEDAFSSLKAVIFRNKGGGTGWR